jgi:hypothetical protein
MLAIGFFNWTSRVDFVRLILQCKMEENPKGQSRHSIFPSEEGGRLALSLCPLPPSSTLRSKLVAEIPYGAER